MDIFKALLRSISQIIAIWLNKHTLNYFQSQITGMVDKQVSTALEFTPDSSNSHQDKTCIKCVSLAF